MNKKLFIDAAISDETRVALLDENNILENIDRETPSIKQLKGNIYLAKIIRLEPSLQSAFINYGGDRHGFLPFSDIHPDYYNIPEERKNDLTAVKFFNEIDKEYNLNNSTNDNIAEEATSEDFEEENFVDLKEIKNFEKMPSENFDYSDNIIPTINNNNNNLENICENNLDIAEDNLDYINENIENSEDNEIEEKTYYNEYKKHKIEDVLKEGQSLLVQVLKEERGNKGVAMTTYISIAGKYSVLMSNVADKGGISKKIVNLRDRKILKNILNTINPTGKKSIIIRTAGIGKKPEDILRDCVYLARVWKAIKKTSIETRAPAFIHSEDDILKRAVRDLFNDKVGEIIIEGKKAYNSIKNLVVLMAPEQKITIKNYEDRIPLFYKSGIEEQVLQLYNNKILLPSGGSIVIDQTEALVAIDVNSGKATKQANVEEMAVATNIEASKEIARQLRLRDIGGLIVIDFIDMFDFKNRRVIERHMRDDTMNDKAKIQIDRISMFGLMEISRQRINASFGEKVSEKCPNCEGKGSVRSKYIVGENILRNIKYCARDKNCTVFTVNSTKQMIEYLLNYKRDEIKKIEEEYKINIIMSIDFEKTNNNYEIKKREELTNLEKLDLCPTQQKGIVNELFSDNDFYKNYEEDDEDIEFSDNCYYNSSDKKSKKKIDYPNNSSSITNIDSINNVKNNKKQILKNTPKSAIKKIINKKIAHKDKNKISIFGKIKSLFK